MSQNELLINSSFNPPSSPDPQSIAEVRITLAIAILGVVVFIPAPNARLLIEYLLYGVISAYVVTALTLYWVALNNPAQVRKGLIYWLDAGWLLTIVSTSGFIDSPLFMLLLFPIFVAAAQEGFAQGVWVAIVTALVCFFLVGWLGDGSAFQTEQYLQAGILLVLGFMVSRWAGAEYRLARELGTINRLAEIPSLHDNEKSFWNDVFEELESYFGMESAFFIGRENAGGYRIFNHEAGQSAQGMKLGEQQAALLSNVPENWAIAWRSDFYTLRHGSAQLVELVKGRTLEIKDDRIQRLADTFESHHWISFPLHTGAAYQGRIFLLGNARFRSRLRWSFIQQLSVQIGLKLDNYLLAHQLAETVASAERERISRDLHDGTVQPYLGLKYGLQALRRKMNGDNELLPEVDELLNMTDSGILQLRGYIRDLRTPEVEDIPSALAQIRTQVQQFESYSGLKVQVSAQNFELEESILHDIRQIVSEGLSNIRRHSNASQVKLELSTDKGYMHIRFINPVEHIAPRFSPRSLIERAATMGGRVGVTHLNTETIVEVVLPIWNHDKK